MTHSSYQSIFFKQTDKGASINTRKTERNNVNSIVDTGCLGIIISKGCMGRLKLVADAEIKFMLNTIEGIAEK